MDEQSGGQDFRNKASLDAPGGPIERLLPMVYQELRSIARRERAHLSGGETLVTTALINEAYLHLAKNPVFATRGDFLRIAAVAMRRILVDRVRTQMAAKRGGGEPALELDQVADFEIEDPKAALRMHEALQTLAELNPRLADIVECRFFAGYGDSEIAEALSISERTVRRDWALARAWLAKEMAA